MTFSMPKHRLITAKLTINGQQQLCILHLIHKVKDRIKLLKFEITVRVILNCK